MNLSTLYISVKEVYFDQPFENAQPSSGLITFLKSGFRGEALGREGVKAVRSLVLEQPIGKIDYLADNGRAKKREYCKGLKS